MPYPRHAAFHAPARPRAELWRTVLGTVLIAVLYLAPFLSMVALAVVLAGPERAGALFDLSGRSPGGLVAVLASFAILALAAALAVRLLHRRGAATLIGPLPQAARDFLRVAPPVLGLGLVLLPFTLAGEAVARNAPLPVLLVWLPLALPALVVQTGAEELVFRGYLQQQLAARFRSPLAWMIVPSALFGLLHHAPEAYGPNALPVALWAFLFGLFAADLTARTGSLGAAAGFHFANNCLAMLLVAAEGELDGLALWVWRADLSDPQAMLPVLAIDLAATVVSWLLGRVALRV